MVQVQQQGDPATLGLYTEVIEKGMDGDIQPFVETLFRIQDKWGDMVPFHLKPAQQAYFDASTPADIILKAAQMGFTTFVILEYLAYAMLRPGIQCLITAQRDDTGTNLFDIAHRVIEAMPESVRPTLLQDSAHKIEIDHSSTTLGMSSIFEVGSANSKTFGRGRPTHYALFTEVGFYDEEAVEMIMGIISRMPPGDSRYVLESTANGMDNYFHKQWLSAVDKTGELSPHFFPWFDDPEYALVYDPELPYQGDVTELDEAERHLVSTQGLTHDQLRWRRMMRARLLHQHESQDFFKQEFPEKPDDAFLPVGSAIFRSEAITAHSYAVREPFSVDQINSRWCDPVPERSYIVSIDQASGEERDLDEAPTDFQVINIFDSVTLEQMHRIRKQGLTHREVAQNAVKLAREYNNALIVPERNLAQWGLVEMINEESYFNIYVHLDGKYGYPVNTATKPVLKDQVVEMLKIGGSTTIHSENLISELRNFRNLKKKGKAAGMGAGPGGHDDEVITFFFVCDPNVRGQAFATRSQGTSSGQNPSGTTFATEVI